MGSEVCLPLAERGSSVIQRADSIPKEQSQGGRAKVGSRGGAELESELDCKLLSGKDSV